MFFWRIHFQVLWHLEKCWRLHNDQEFKKKFWGTIAPLNRPLCAWMFCFPKGALGEFDHLSFPKLCVGMLVNEAKFERNSVLRYHHMTCVEKTKHKNLKLRANGRNNFQQFCVRLHGAERLTGFKLSATTHNNTQQHPTTLRPFARSLRGLLTTKLDNVLRRKILPSRRVTQPPERP